MASQLSKTPLVSRIWVPNESFPGGMLIARITARSPWESGLRRQSGPGNGCGRRRDRGWRRSRCSSFLRSSAWAVPEAFAAAVCSYRFEQGDVLHRERRGYEQLSGPDSKRPNSDPAAPAAAQRARDSERIRRRSAPRELAERGRARARGSRVGDERIANDDPGPALHGVSGRATRGGSTADRAEPPLPRSARELAPGSARGTGSNAGAAGCAHWLSVQLRRGSLERRVANQGEHGGGRVAHTRAEGSARAQAERARCAGCGSLPSDARAARGRAARRRCRGRRGGARSARSTPARASRSGSRSRDTACSSGFPLRRRSL